MLQKVLIIIGILFMAANTFAAKQNQKPDSSKRGSNEKSSIQDSVSADLEEARQRQLEIDYLETQRQLQESQLKQRQEEQRRQQTIIYLGFSFFILMIAIIFGLIRRNMKLRKFLKEKGYNLDELEKG